MKVILSKQEAVLGLVVLLLIGLAASIMTTETKADYVATVAPDNVTVQISGDLTQGARTTIPNATTSGFGTFPSFRGSLSGQNGTLLDRLVVNAVETKTPEAVATGVSFQVTSNTTSLHYDLSFSVTGISSEQNSVERVNMEWRSFTIADDFSVGSASINRLFPNYLEQTLIRLAQTQPNSLLQERIQLFVNGRLRPNSQARAEAQNLLLFNFSSLALPLQSWARASGPNPSTIILQATTGFNVTYTDTFTESGETGTAVTNAIYNLKARIQTPAYSLLSNNQILFETSGAVRNYELMIGIVITPTVLLVSTLITEKRLRGSKRYHARKTGK